ncbi:MAG TPA: hypothetical protein VNZ22_16800, partial [Bacillota bacterium]|nr:hypothetical protein [Bacillota bacterium]
QAIMVGPSVMGGGKAPAWIEGALDAQGLRGSPAFQKQAKPYSIGPVLDAVSFHVYEGLDSAFSGQDRTLEVAFGEIRRVFEQWEERAAGFAYPRKQEYWHTEGNFDFFGVLSAERRAAWRLQFFTRAFAAGVRKVVVMDASKPEQAAVRAYVRVLPDPFPMERAETQARILSGRPVLFWHRDSTNATAGRVWVVWATAGTGEATVEIPCLREAVSSVSVDGAHNSITPTNGRVQLQLRGDAKMAPPVLLIDRSVVEQKQLN